MICNFSKVATNNKDAILNSKDEKPMRNGIDQPNAADQTIDILNAINEKLASSMSAKEYRQLISLSSLQ